MLSLINKNKISKFEQVFIPEGLFNVLIPYITGELKTMVAFQTVKKKYKYCFQEELVKGKKKLISEVKGKYGVSPLRYLKTAAAFGDLRDVKILLLDNNIDLNYGGIYRYTALEFATKEGYINVVDFLLKQKNMNCINQQTRDRGRTVLHTASYWGRTEIVKLLLNQSDIKYNLKDYGGKTALNIASEEGYTKIVNLLKEKIL